MNTIATLHTISLSLIIDLYLNNKPKIKAHFFMRSKLLGVLEGLRSQ